jgi:hypothetical protein
VVSLFLLHLLFNTNRKGRLGPTAPAAKAYFAECILKAAAQGQTNYDALIVAAADQIEVFVSLFS